MPHADPDRRAAAEPTASMRTLRDADFGAPEARHLLRRAGFDAPPAEVRRVAAMGTRAAVEHLLDWSGGAAEPDGTDLFPNKVPEPTAAQRDRLRRARREQDEDTLAALRKERQRAQRLDRRQGREMQKWWLRRMIDTPYPLQEKLTLFWHGLLVSSYRGVENSAAMYQQNRLYRRLASAGFGDLLGGIIRDPAMLTYLNNRVSHKKKPNENLARELMELFSLGEGHYTERDIKEGARALTGYSVESGAFLFREDWHDGGSKRILGRRGRLDGDDFIGAILDEDACSAYLAARLYAFFVAPLPEDPRRAPRPVRSVLQKMARMLRDKDYRVGPVLDGVFRSEHFYDPANRLALVKSPTEMVVGMARAMGTPLRRLSVVLGALGHMGQTLFLPPSVAGWAGGRAWINTSTLPVRHNTALYLCTGIRRERPDRADRAPFDPWAVLGTERDPEPLARRVLGVALGELGDPAAGPAARARYDALVGFARASQQGPTDTAATMLALAATAPEFQLC